jgi:hypothetical protein
MLQLVGAFNSDLIMDPSLELRMTKKKKSLFSGTLVN